MKIEQTPSPGIVDRFGLEAFARSFSHQLNALLVWKIQDGRIGTQLSNSFHLPLHSPVRAKISDKTLEQ